jgi:hypothetical protein
MHTEDPSMNVEDIVAAVVADPSLALRLAAQLPPVATAWESAKVQIEQGQRKQDGWVRFDPFGSDDPIVVVYRHAGIWTWIMDDSETDATIDGEDFKSPEDAKADADAVLSKSGVLLVNEAPAAP